MCHKILLSEIEPNRELESISICGDCKLLFLTQQRTLSTPESLENILSQEFPDMINGRSRQLRRVLSDSESDGFDSVSGDSDYIFPYALYSDDSEASVIVDNDVDSDTDTGTDTDLDTDPIHSGLNQWNSDDYDDSIVGRARLRRSLATNGRNLSPDWLREILSPEAGIGIGISDRNGIDERMMWHNAGEYNDGEPAAALFVKNLERVVVDDDVEGLVCVICKESVCVGGVVNRLPCLHVYHASCIMPWLNAHNTCPLCRYELPTDGQMRPNRTHGLAVQSVGGSGGDSDGGGGGWWFVVATLVSVVGAGVMMWLGGGSSQMDNIRKKWWSLL